MSGSGLSLQAFSSTHLPLLLSPTSNRIDEVWNVYFRLDIHSYMQATISTFPELTDYFMFTVLAARPLQIKLICLSNFQLILASGNLFSFPAAVALQLRIMNKKSAVTRVAVELC